VKRVRDIPDISTDDDESMSDGNGSSGSSNPSPVKSKDGTRKDI
jgi:hypothetical protein